jgi:hypothetical protein
LKATIRQGKSAVSELTQFRKVFVVVNIQGESTMQPEIYAAIQLEWCKISNEEHRSLIYDYLKENETFNDRSWMEFLRAYFNIEERPAIRFSRTQNRKPRFKSAA